MVVIVTGMHRSGTSMLANILQSHGVCMGSVLKEGDRNNPFGYFEDPDFFKFHQKILERACGHNWMVTQSANFILSDRQEAERLKTKRNSYENWGWKDPRTTIFLEDWLEILGHKAVFLLIWRRCADVVSSCMRRSQLEIAPFKSLQKSLGTLRERLYQFKKAYLRKNEFTRIWMFYNNLLLNFIRQHPESRHVLLFVDDVLQYPEVVTEQLNQLSSHNFLPPSASILEPKAMSQKTSDWILSFRYRWQVKQIEEKLLKYSTRKG